MSSSAHVTHPVFHHVSPPASWEFVGRRGTGSRQALSNSVLPISGWISGRICLKTGWFIVRKTTQLVWTEPQNDAWPLEFVVDCCSCHRARPVEFGDDFLMPTLALVAILEVQEKGFGVQVNQDFVMPTFWSDSNCNRTWRVSDCIPCDKLYSSRVISEKSHKNTTIQTDLVLQVESPIELTVNRRPARSVPRFLCFLCWSGSSSPPGHTEAPHEGPFRTIPSPFFGVVLLGFCIVHGEAIWKPMVAIFKSHSLTSVMTKIWPPATCGSISDLAVRITISRENHLQMLGPSCLANLFALYSFGWIAAKTAGHWCVTGSPPKNWKVSSRVHVLRPFGTPAFFSLRHSRRWKAIAPFSSTKFGFWSS